MKKKIKIKINVTNDLDKKKNLAQLAGHRFEQRHV